MEDVLLYLAGAASGLAIGSLLDQRIRRSTRLLYAAGTVIAALGAWCVLAEASRLRFPGGREAFAAALALTGIGVALLVTRLRRAWRWRACLSATRAPSEATGPHPPR